jgi:hypothetical protein
MAPADDSKMDCQSLVYTVEPEDSRSLEIATSVEVAVLAKRAPRYECP